MYYGRGAGKLPTASAVVSDVVDCARHPGKTIMCFWDVERVTLADISAMHRRFFVRVSADRKDKALSLFENISQVDAGFADELAFTTDVMTEKEFDEKISALGGSINRIRLES